MKAAVLFARRDSVYKTIKDLDVYDQDRDALTYSPGLPIIAHPPCRGWGRLKAFSNHTESELDLARFAVRQIRANGGVLEHPYGSGLWADQGLPSIDRRDQYGGYTLPVFQWWWGHRAQKATLLYIVGCEPRRIPAFPFNMSLPTHVVENYSGVPVDRRRPVISKAEREQTPVAFAYWLIDLVGRVQISERAVA